MELILIKSYNHFKFFEKDWITILDENQNTNPFIEYENVSNWLKHSDGKTEIEIYAVKEHNRVIAFFPFQLKKTWFGNVFQFLTVGDTYYVDIIARNRDMKRIIMYGLDNIISQKKNAVFLLQGKVEGGATFDNLSDYLRARNLKEQTAQMITSEEEVDENRRKIIFSTNTVKAKTYLNLLLLKEKVKTMRINRVSAKVKR
ncbi:hypothetical protein SAMN05518872_10575 [Psychrobacillus sp. OK032]|nr:hypothetical protein SAMN05518872_10575 [Psychrobacillus sp. OK032]